MSITREVRDAVRRGAAEHARTATARRRVRPTTEPTNQVSCAHILEALEEAPGGLNVKTRIALTSIVKHVTDLDRRVTLLERAR